MFFQAYSENPADFKPLTTEEMAKIKAEKRQKDQVWRRISEFNLQIFSGQEVEDFRKPETSSKREGSAEEPGVRGWIITKVDEKYQELFYNFFLRLADPEILRKPDYFGKFGKIHKVVINHSTQYAGSQIQVNI